MKPIIELYINNLIFTGWKDVRIKRSIENMSSAFTLEVTDKINNNPLSIQAGLACYLDINGQRVITGYIDEVTLDITGDNQTITITGRDKTADLIDCAAIYKTGQWREVTLEKIAKDLCAPFNIDVVWSVNDAAASELFKWWQIEPSETVFENLARAARQRGVLLTSNEQGNLVFMSAGSKNVASLTLGENILSLNITKSFQHRFSIYRVLGDSSGGYLWGVTQTPNQSTAVVADAKDNAITRYRPTIILADDNLIMTTGKTRADWERRRSIAHSQPVTVVVKDWFYGGNKLWQPNQLITLNAKDYQNTELLIVDVDFNLGNDNGITTTLLLMPRNGFIAPKELETTPYLWQNYDGY